MVLAEGYVGESLLGGGGVKVKVKVQVQVQQGAMYVPRQVGIRRRDEQNLPRWTTPTSTSKRPRRLVVTVDSGPN